MLFKKLCSFLLPLTSVFAADIAMFIIEGSPVETYQSAIKSCEEQGYGIEQIFVPKEGLQNIEATLYETNNAVANPKYRVLVFPNGRVSFKEDGRWESAITEDQWLQIESYARANEARLVYLNEYPSEKTGTRLYSQCEKEKCKEQYLITQTINAKPGVLLADQINSAGLETNGIYHFPAAISQTTDMQVEVALTFSAAPPDFPEETVAAVTLNKSGANIMAFYMAFGGWSKDSSALNTLWLSWAYNTDLKHVEGSKTDTQTAFKEASSGSVKTTNLEVLFVTFSAIFTIFFTLF